MMAGRLDTNWMCFSLPLPSSLSARQILHVKSWEMILLFSTIVLDFLFSIGISLFLLLCHGITALTLLVAEKVVMLPKFAKNENILVSAHSKSKFFVG